MPVPNKWTKLELLGLGRVMPEAIKAECMRYPASPVCNNFDAEIIRSHDATRLDKTSSEMSRILQIAQTGQKFYC